MGIQSYRDLRVWQGAMDLVVEVYRITTRFPERELYGLVSQMRRTAVEIPASIAQGHTLEATRDFLHHINRAQGHLATLQTHLEVVQRLGYLAEDECGAALDRTVTIFKQLYALRNALHRDD
ncbi:MAG TPA: four helix bundle protein [Isosphaeraceae bacterium]|jgi:four helix bundle protein|nr:four helix bundle protein [Isosphaeraceae bacterium]